MRAPFNRVAGRHAGPRTLVPKAARQGPPMPLPKAARQAPPAPPPVALRAPGVIHLLAPPEATPEGRTDG
jgi:hypothetical protein